ncbi:hypothetical protein, partial [Pseudoxanthomonas winnipegensis]|uniref:hypothetical protein n=1 Tax=Pseudoxanthomonas winnipegensis TaxID=2480810 RepID=UPI0030F39841
MHHAARGAVISIDHEQMPQAHQRPWAYTAFNPKTRETSVIVIPAFAGMTDGRMVCLSRRPLDPREWRIAYFPPHPGICAVSRPP